MSDPYEEAADIICASFAGRELPRAEVIKRMKQRCPDPEAFRVELERTRAEAERFAAELTAIGKTIAYDAADLERTRKLQREFKA